MNATFYLAIARLPLGTVGGIEFLGPILLAALGTRTLRNVFALVLAVAGVWLLTDVRLAGEPVGFIFAFANCALFMLYVTLGHRIAQDGGATGIDRLGAAMLIALVVVSPIGFADAAPAFTQPVLLLAGIGVGVCSSVIPYVTDQLALARLSRATFALMLALLPAFASVIGVIVLRQIPTPDRGGRCRAHHRGRRHAPRRSSLGVTTTREGRLTHSKQPSYRPTPRHSSRHEELAATPVDGAAGRRSRTSSHPLRPA